MRSIVVTPTNISAIFCIVINLLIYQLNTLPSPEPTPKPSRNPTERPTFDPIPNPTPRPTRNPSFQPTTFTNSPTESTLSPSINPTTTFPTSTASFTRNFLLTLEGDFEVLLTNLTQRNITLERWAIVAVSSGIGVDEYPSLSDINITIIDVFNVTIQIDYILKCNSATLLQLAITNINSASNITTGTITYTVISNALITKFPTNIPSKSPTYNNISRCFIGHQCDNTEQCCPDNIDERSYGITCTIKYRNSTYWINSNDKTDRGCCIKVGYECLSDIVCCSKKTKCHNGICLQQTHIIYNSIINYKQNDKQVYVLNNVSESIYMLIFVRIMVILLGLIFISLLCCVFRKLWKTL